MVLWMRVSGLLGVWGIVLLGVGCDGQWDPDGSASPSTALDPCEVTTASYETVGEPFMSTWCTPCHHSELVGDDRPVGSEAVNLDTFELVIEHLDRIEVRAASEAPTMPPGGGPSEEDIERLRLWLDCGAVETTQPAP